MTKDLIYYNISIDYRSFANNVSPIIQKITVKITIDLFKGEFAIYINITEEIAISSEKFGLNIPIIHSTI